MSDTELTQAQLEQLCEKHKAKMSTIPTLMMTSNSDEHPQVFEAVYKPFFLDACELYGFKDNIPVPPGETSTSFMYNAWRFGKFGKVLEHIKGNLGSAGPDLAPLEGAKAAWDTPYVGEAHHLLREAINEIRLKDSFRERTMKYGNFFAIIQGSGTGKSRAVDELSRSVFTIPFVLRKAEEKMGYPAMDTVAQSVGDRQPLLNLFRVLTGSAETIQDEHLLLLLKCLDHAKNWLNKPNNKDLRLKETIRSWREHIKLEHQELHDHMGSEKPTLREILELKSDSQGKPTKKDIHEKVIEYTNNVVGLLEQRKSNASDPKPYILFAFDEAHHLTMDRTNETDASMSRTAYQCLCKALSYFTGAQVFALFLSTYSRLSAFSPSNRNFWSSRGLQQAGDEALWPPFVELPFDIGPKPLKGILVQEKAHTITEICTLDFMARFGRPLQLLSLAIQKLDVSHDGNLSLPYSVDEPNLLPLLAIRVDLTFESNRDEAIYLESLLVASSSRTVYSVPRHRQYLRGSYPSEPLLAEAASQKLHQVFSQPASTTATALNLEELKNIYKTKLPGLLNKWLASGLISKGDRGELVARLLLTLAHDLAVLNILETSDTVKFSRKIPVVDFLSALISPQYVGQVLNATPCNLKSDTRLLDAFQDAFVHFTHFVKGDDNSIVTDEACMIFMARGAAIQGYTALPDMDIIIPICMKDEPLSRWNMSAIFIQIKNRLATKSVHIDVEGGGKGKFHFFSNSDARPYITLTMEFGITAPQALTGYPWKAPSSATKEHGRKRRRRISEPELEPEPKQAGTPARINVSQGPTKEQLPRDKKARPKNHPRYNITITGCSPTVYNVVAHKDDYKSLLANTDLLQEHPREGKFRDAVLQMKPYFKYPESYAFAQMDKENPSNLDNEEHPKVSQEELVESVYIDIFDGALTDLSEESDEDGGDKLDQGDKWSDNDKGNTLSSPIPRLQFDEAGAESNDNKRKRD
ncbi:hypothetical protein H0H92_002298 [Tricholoma furcatifolium]|nr:hypothetical protein H0H92_002298 [Tricholoma furcatifolium]